MKDYKLLIRTVSATGGVALTTVTFDRKAKAEEAFKLIADNNLFTVIRLYESEGI